MATSTLIPVEEYLHTSYSPDCDFVDGVVQERNAGERSHAKLQRLLIIALSMLNGKERPGVHVYPEQRVQVSPTRFRIPDICVVAGPETARENFFPSPE